MKNKLQKIREFLEQNNAKSMDISEDRIFNCPPDICKGHYLTVISVTPNGLRFEGRGWDDDTIKIIQEKEISEKEVGDILEFIEKNREYIKEYAAFS